MSLPRWAALVLVFGVGLLIFYNNFPDPVNRRTIASYSMRKPSQKTVNLEEELSAYERRRALAETRFEIDLASVNTSRDDTRYLIYHSGLQNAIGLGNTKMVVVSAFLYALLTNRTFLAFEERYDVQQVFQSPVYWTKRFAHKPGKSLETLSEWSKHARLIQIGSDTRQLSCMGDNAQFVWIMSDQYWVPNIFQVPEFIEKLNMFFPDRNVFNVLEAYLFPISPSLTPLVYPILDQYAAARAEGRRVVGLHIRTFVFSKKVTTAENAMLCIQQRNLNFSKTVFFLATLNATIRSVLEKSGAKVISQLAESNQAYDLRHIQVTAADVFLLSEADDLILSGGSTMSYSAGGRRGDFVNYISPDGCALEDWEPCMHDGLSPPVKGCNPTSSLVGEITRRCGDTALVQHPVVARATKLSMHISNSTRREYTHVS